jgi:L-arginine dehydrogenase
VAIEDMFLKCVDPVVGRLERDLPLLGVLDLACLPIGAGGRAEDLAGCDEPNGTAPRPPGAVSVGVPFASQTSTAREGTWMGFRYLDEAAVRERLRLEQVVPALERAFVGLTTAASIQPAQTVTVFPDGAGDTIFYPGALLSESVVGVKVSPYLASLARAGDSPVTAFTLLLSVETGQPVALCDSRFLTTVRTGATTALAVRELAHRAAGTLAVIGTGPVAEWHVRFALGMRDWSAVTFYSPSINAPTSAGRRAELTALADQVRVAPSLVDCVADADVIMLCTSSGTPVLPTELVGPGTLVTSITTNVARAHEVPPEFLLAADVFCDLRTSAPLAAGEMLLAAERFGWQAGSIVADLPELLAGTTGAEPDFERPRFFRSIGLGIEDLALAALLV